MRCVVCGRSGAAEHHTAGGAIYARACRGECAGLAWEAYFLRATGASRDELDDMAWQWRRRRADVEGRVFLEPAPASSVERAALQSVALLAAD